jgi:hypothetical protein
MSKLRDSKQVYCCYLSFTFLLLYLRNLSQSFIYHHFKTRINNLIFTFHFFEYLKTKKLLLFFYLDHNDST